MRDLRSPIAFVALALTAAACASARAPESKAGGSARVSDEATRKAPEPVGENSQSQTSGPDALREDGARRPFKASPYNSEAKRALASAPRVRLPEDLDRRRVNARSGARPRAILACLVLDQRRHDARRGRAIAAELAREKSVASSFVLDDWQGEQSLAALGTRAASRKADYLLVLQEGERRAVMIFAPSDLALLARSGAAPEPGGDSALAAVFRRACRIWDAR